MSKEIGKVDIVPFLLLMSLLAGCIEIDMSIPSFPDIAKEFNADIGLIQLTIALNFAGFVVGALIYGPLSESYGRRKIILFGTIMMALGAIGCVFSNSIEFLLISRIIQGMGACAPVVIVFAIISDKYEGAKMYGLFGLVNAFMSIVMALAPLIGGWVNYYLGWRGNYSVVAFITLISLISLMLFLPETKQDKVIVNWRFLANSYRKIATNSTFLIASLVPSLLFSAYMVFIASSAFLYRGTFELSLFKFVIHFFFIVASFSITSLLSSKLTTVLGGAETTEKMGLFLIIASLCSLVIFGYTAFIVTVLMCIFCIGFAMLYPIVFGRSMSVFPEMFGVASAFNMSSRSLLVVGSTTLSSVIYTGKLQEMVYVMLGLSSVALVLTIIFYIQKDKKTLTGT